ncbi:FimB/Mfa2 family fimbrial subunit, partial [Alistipes sp. OttesenSCG-928-L06]|nr:FimB/Mfa2 family fimbrial subunit [Alistipes sp. OttesenSCG-928-L06]
RQGVSLQPSGPLLHYVTANVTKHTNHINLKVRFEDYTPPAASRLNAYIEARNGEYHYVGHSCRDNTYKTYVPHQQGPTLDSPTDFRMTTLRLWHGEQEDIRLYVRETRSADPNQTRVVSLNLAEELAKVKNNVGEYLYNTNEKLEFHDEYDIILTLGPDFVVVGLTIANWSVIGGGVGV